MKFYEDIKEQCTDQNWRGSRTLAQLLPTKFVRLNESNASQNKEKIYISKGRQKSYQNFDERKTASRHQTSDYSK